MASSDTEVNVEAAVEGAVESAQIALSSIELITEPSTSGSVIPSTSLPADPPPLLLSLLSLPDSILRSIIQCFVFHYDWGYTPTSINYIMRVCRRLYIIGRPLLWQYVMINNSASSGLILRSWLLYPETRQLTKALWSSAPDGPDEVFISSVLCLEDLGLRELDIHGRAEEGLPKRVMEGIDKYADQLKILRLKDYTGIEDLDSNFWIKEKFQGLREIEIGYPPKKPERWFGLKELEYLTVAFRADGTSEEDPAEGEEIVSGALDKSISILAHYLPMVKSLRVCWDACNCCSSMPFHRQIKATFALKEDQSILAPNLRHLSLSNIQLFYSTDTPSGPLCSILRGLAASPDLRRIHFLSCGRFSPPDDYEDQWKELRMPHVRRVVLASHWMYDDSFGGIMNDNTLRPLLHFIQIFPRLRFLDLPQAFSSESTLSTSLPPSAKELSLAHPSLSVFLDKILRDTDIISLRLGMIHFYRPNKDLTEWESELMKNLELYM